MSRDRRAVHVDPFAVHDDFNSQLFEGLRQAPWWMISIAVHVLAFVVAALLVQQAPHREVARQVGLSAYAPPEEIAPDEEEPTPTVVDPLATPEVIVPQPDFAPEITSDNDLPDEGTLGEDGLDTSGFTGPANNALIGLGGHAGGPARGPFGGNRDGGPLPGGDGQRAAVEDALRWLAAHQSPNGAWEAAGFGRWCDLEPQENGPEGAGKALYDPGVTGLALCAFLGAGYTHRGDHPFVKTVARGLQYLRNVQDAEGCYGARAGQHYIYNHATAALAMVEAYGLTESPILGVSAQRALDFIGLCRNPYFAWRYGIRPGENDTSVTGWMMMALKSARIVNEDATRRGRKPPFLIDEEAFDGIRTWIDKATDPDTGRTGYLERGGLPARPQHLLDAFPADRSESMTGVGVLARIFIGEDPRRSEMVRKGAAVLARCPPRWDATDGSIDMYYWYYATLAMFQVGGSSWKQWEEAMRGAVVTTQRKDTDYCRYKGSWDPLGPWGEEGGRVYATALMAMCLEVYYRYDRVFGTKLR